MKKLLFILFILLISGMLFADSYQIVYDKNGEKKGGINWTKGIYEAIGIAALALPSKQPNRAQAEVDAITVAQMKALRNISFLIDGTDFGYKLESDHDNLITDTMKAAWQGKIKGVVFSEPELIKNSKGKVEKVKIKCTIPMMQANYPIIKEIVKEERTAIETYKAEIFAQGKSIPQPSVKMETNAEIVIVPNEVLPVTIANDPQINRVDVNTTINIIPAKRSIANKPYTGLIIDARGFKLSRSMSPRIRIGNGDIVWCGANYDMEFLQNKGIVSYLSSMEAAKKSDRAGSNPLIINAINIAGPALIKTDLIISDEDAAVLKDENQKSNPKFLDVFQVVVVCDSYQ